MNVIRGVGNGLQNINPFRLLPFGPGGNQQKESKTGAQAKTENALASLRLSAQDFEARLADLQRRRDEATEQVKQHMSRGEKPKALVVLKRKKMLDKQAQSVQNNVDRLEEQIFQMEMSQNNIVTISALQDAAQAGQANLQANDIEDVDLVLDEIAEQNDQMGQIQDALAQSTMAGAIDDDDLEAELNELQNMSIDEEFAEASVPVTQAQPAVAEQPAAAQEEVMPSVPAQPIAVAVPSSTGGAAQRSDEDAQLERLMAETGMT